MKVCCEKESASPLNKNYFAFNTSIWHHKKILTSPCIIVTNCSMNISNFFCLTVLIVSENIDNLQSLCTALGFAKARNM